MFTPEVVEVPEVGGEVTAMLRADNVPFCRYVTLRRSNVEADALIQGALERIHTTGGGRGRGVVT